MADSNPFSKMVPGFDFLQGLVKNAGQALPSKVVDGIVARLKQVLAEEAQQ